MNADPQVDLVLKVARVPLVTTVQLDLQVPLVPPAKRVNGVKPVVMVTKVNLDPAETKDLWELQALRVLVVKPVPLVFQGLRVWMVALVWKVLQGKTVHKVNQASLVPQVLWVALVWMVCLDLVVKWAQMVLMAVLVSKVPEVHLVPLVVLETLESLVPLVLLVLLAHLVPPVQPVFPVPLVSLDLRVNVVTRVYKVTLEKLARPALLVQKVSPVR